jgi:hypothetical protein
MALSNAIAAKLNDFEAAYDTAHEDAAFESRGDFLNAFPRLRLKHLRLDSYVIGLQSPTFCSYVEVKTRPWAVIQGANAFKFGIYFGRTKSHPEKIYRFSNKFGADQISAFRAVKAALLTLVGAAAHETPDFAAIDANPLSQMFKAKILSLYFPERFLNVCSGEHLEMLGQELGMEDGLLLSEYQHGLLRAKLTYARTTAWSNPKFMAFLYRTFINTETPPSNPIEKLKTKIHRKVNFEDIHDQRNIIGKRAEHFALNWEKTRLRGAGLKHLIHLIDDRTDRPGFGYDILSYTADNQPRYIEVKSVGKIDQGYRFFLSDNEHEISLSSEHSDSYYFYLVIFDGKRNPVDLIPVLANTLYPEAEMQPSSYTVRFAVRPSWIRT